jgi:hypothetical protein
VDSGPSISGRREEFEASSKREMDHEGYADFAYEPEDSVVRKNIHNRLNFKNLIITHHFDRGDEGAGE